MFIAAIAGIFAGAVHVLSGPDHLAAIAPLASDGGRRTWQAGALWGVGHSSGVFLVGLLALLFKDWLPLDALSSWSERLVGIVLLAIGLWGLLRALRWRVHTHTHAAFAVGIVHGFAGSSHVLAILPALALPGLGASLGYLSGYGVGTIVAMSGFSSAIGFVATKLDHTGPGAARWLLSGCSVTAMLVGVAWLSL